MAILARLKAGAPGGRPLLAQAWYGGQPVTGRCPGQRPDGSPSCAVGLGRSCQPAAARIPRALRARPAERGEVPRVRDLT